MMNLKPRLSRDGVLQEIDRGWRLWIPAGSATSYRLSQLDDHLHMARRDYPCSAPTRLELDARVSSATLPGTWGFGLWNDPYGFSIGPGDGFLRLPALPNAAWFFYSSPVSYLSFRDDKPANGLLAQTFSSPGFRPLLLRAALTLPFAPRAARRLLTRIIREDSARLDGTAPAAIDTTQWHRYALDWTAERTRFLVDDAPVLDTPLSPRGPLGIVIWIDNQHAAFTPAGKISFGAEPNPAPAWMEIRNVRKT